MDMDSLMISLSKIKYEWIILSLVIGILSHVARAMRWQMLATSIGYKTKFANSFFAVMIAYLANLALPRLGEVTRPTVLKKYEGIPYPICFGTIVLERIIDMIILLLITFIAFVSEYSVFSEFLHKNPDVYDKFVLVFKFLVIAGIAFGIFIAVFYYFVRKRIKHIKIYKKFSELAKSFLEGLKTLKNVKNIPLFVFYSLFIWTLYFLMLYVAFFAFGFTAHLGLMAGLVAFVLSSFGMVAPIQGGIGAWHFMIIGTFVIYNIDFVDAKFFALVAHSSQMLMLLVVGCISLILLPIFNKKKK